MTWFSKKQQHNIKKILIFTLSFLFLNLVVNIANIWEHGNLFFGLYLAPEVIVSIFAFVVVEGLFPSQKKRSYFFISGFLILICIAKISIFAVPKFFHRPFNLYIDASYVPHLLHFLYHSLPLWKSLLFSSLFIVTGISFIYVMNKSFRFSLSCIAMQRKKFFLTIAILFFIDFSGFYLFYPSCVHKLTRELEFIRNKTSYEKNYMITLQQAKDDATSFSSNLQNLNKQNVFVFFIESYGKTVFSKKEHLDLIKPTLNQFSTMLANNKYNVCSNYIISPTFGGNSWLAHGAFSCGVRTFNQIIFDALLASKVKPLAKYFNDAGYRTVSAMPGTTKPWPAGKFFGFQKKYYSWDFNYEGPFYGWSPMNDQYVINYIHEKEVLTAKKPLFLEYVLISSHAPFHIQPPYLENWNDLGNGKIFHNKPVITFPIVWPDLSNATKGYVRSIEYVFITLESYLANKIDDNSLIIILGDHQPHGTITGAQPSWAVPIHIISRDKKMLEPFLNDGYCSGLYPKQEPGYEGMEEFLRKFLIDFSDK